MASLLNGLVDYAARTRDGGFDPVAAAAALAFGFVYIHPSVDGNGRIHRWLIQHALAAADFNPPGLVFPVSAAILRRLDEYRVVLESYSRPLLPEIEWRRTPKGQCRGHEPARHTDRSRHRHNLNFRAHWALLGRVRSI